MGKKKYCTYCIEVYRKTISPNWGSNSIIEDGCDKCQSRHGSEIYSLEGKVKSLQLEIDEKKKDYEAKLSDLVASNSHDLIKQKTKYEELLSLSNHEVCQLKDDNDRLHRKVQFLQIRRDSSIGDLVVAAPDLNVTAHRAILAAKSPVFQEMVQSSETAERRAEGIKIHDISPSVLEAIVEFCYTGEITFSKLVPADEVLSSAHTFQLGLLREYCDAELCRGLTVENLPQMLKLSRKFDATRLQEEAGKVFKKHFDLVQSKVFEVLEGSDSSIAESRSGSCLDLEEHPDDQWNTV